MAFDLDSWNAPKEINDDGMDYLDSFSKEGKQYIIGQRDTPQEALDDLKVTLRRNRENPDKNRFLFLDFEGIMKPGQQNAVENLRFFIGQTNCKIIVTTECRHGGYSRVNELWKEYGIPIEYDPMAPIVSAPTYKDPVTEDVHK